jgi:tRNA A-37 threonylcarbamoyl transferase component Bud32
MWDAKTLHSHMPNITDFDRYMLVMNYLDERIVKDVMDYEASLLS